MLLPKLAELFGVTTDEILSCQKTNPIVEIVGEERKKDLDSLVMRIIVNSGDGDKVKINLPMSLIKMGAKIGSPQISGNSSLKDIDFTQIVEMAEKGVLGKLLEVQSADGDNVEIVVEEK